MSEISPLRRVRKLRSIEQLRANKRATLEQRANALANYLQQTPGLKLTLDQLKQTGATVALGGPCTWPLLGIDAPVEFEQTPPTLWCRGITSQNLQRIMQTIAQEQNGILTQQGSETIVQIGAQSLIVDLPEKFLSVHVTHNGLDAIYAMVLRDFTIDSIMMVPETGAIMDPENAVEDLQAGMIKPLKAGVWTEQVRLRALKLLSQGFSLDTETDELLFRANSPDIKQAEQALGFESSIKLIQEVLMSKQPKVAMEFAEELGILFSLYPALVQSARNSPSNYERFAFLENANDLGLNLESRIAGCLRGFDAIRSESMLEELSQSEEVYLKSSAIYRGITQFSVPTTIDQAQNSLYHFGPELAKQILLTKESLSPERANFKAIDLIDEVLEAGIPYRVDQLALSADDLHNSNPQASMEEIGSFQDDLLQAVMYGVENTPEALWNTVRELNWNVPSHALSESDLAL